MMKKLAAVGLLMLAMVALAPGQANAEYYEENQWIIYVNGYPIYSDVEPFTMNDRVMVPLRFVSEALGATVEWNERRQEAFIYNGEDIIAAMEDYPIYKNGEEVYSDVWPVMSADRLFVPLRAISEAMYCSVDYDPYLGEIYINSY